MNLQNKTLNFTIICEYNPFHGGHLRQIELIRSEYPDSTVTAVMSGNFVQRGEAAIYDKYKRAEAAVKCGVDLVLELPFPWCASSGEFFASAGVTLIDGLGIFDCICFGSESGDVEYLHRLAERSADSEFDAAVAEAAKKGSSESYIRLRQRLYRETYGEDFVTSPNDILGVEYLKSLTRLNSKVVPYIIKREGGYSATNSRRLIRTGDISSLTGLLPPSMLETVLTDVHTDISNLTAAVLYKLRTSDAAELETYADIPVGMGRRLIDAANDSTTMAELYEKSAQKLYTDARIRRMILSAMTGTTMADLRAKPTYTTVLAFNERGAELLSQIKAKRRSADDETEIPHIITKPSAASKLTGTGCRQYELSRRAEILYGLCKTPPKRAGDDLRRGPYILKKEDN